MPAGFESQYNECKKDKVSCKVYDEKTVEEERYGKISVPLQDKFDAVCEQMLTSYWLGDGVHPTSMGYWLIKEEWIKAFEEMRKE